MGVLGPVQVNAPLFLNGRAGSEGSGEPDEERVEEKEPASGEQNHKTSEAVFSGALFDALVRHGLFRAGGS